MIVQNLLWVFLGGGLGSALRYLLSKNLNPLFSNIFIGTFTVNLIGCLIIGILIGLESKSILNKPLLLFSITGFCGGFTTFSAFASENLNFIKSGDYTYAILYSLGSIIIGILAVALGLAISKQF